MSQSPILERRNIAKDHLVFEEGEQSTHAYIVQAGRLRVFTEHNGKQVDLSILEVGDIFGEMALIQNIKRTASVQAIEDCNLIVISKEVFQDKLRASDATIRAVVKMLSERVMSSNAEIVKSKGVNVDSFISLLNQLFRDLLSTMPPGEQDLFRSEAFPAMKNLVDVIEKYRDYL